MVHTIGTSMLQILEVKILGSFDYVLYIKIFFEVDSLLFKDEASL